MAGIKYETKVAITAPATFKNGIGIKIIFKIIFTNNPAETDAIIT